MNLDGNENHDISLELAAEWTANYRNTNPGDTISHYFGKQSIQSILQQEGAVGIRIYYANNEKGEKQLIVVGVKSDGNDIYLGQLAEKSIKCPPNCPLPNPLNT